MEEMDSIGQGKSRGHPRGSSNMCVSKHFHWGSEAFNSESLIIFQSTNIIFYYYMRPGVVQIFLELLCSKKSNILEILRSLLESP